MQQMRKEKPSAGSGEPSGIPPNRLPYLVGTALLPLLILAVVGLLLLGREQQLQVDQAQSERVRALTGAVDLELFSSVAALIILALSQYLTNGDLRRFHEQATAAIGARPDWDGIILIDRAGNRLLNTRVRYGDPIPGGARPVERDSMMTVLITGNASIGNLVKGPGGNYRFPIRVPVIRNNEMRYVLTAFVKPDMMQEFVKNQKIGDDSTAAIFDSDAHIVARSRDQEQLLGSPVSDGLRGLLAKSNEGTAELISREGRPIYTAYVRSARSQWGVAIGTLQTTVKMPVWRSYLLSAVGLLLSVVLTFLLSKWLARRIGGNTE